LQLALLHLRKRRLEIVHLLDLEARLDLAPRSHLHDLPRILPVAHGTGIDVVASKHHSHGVTVADWDWLALGQPHTSQRPPVPEHSHALRVSAIVCRAHDNCMCAQPTGQPLDLLANCLIIVREDVDEVLAPGPHGKILLRARVNADAAHAHPVCGDLACDVSQTTSCTRDDYPLAGTGVTFE